jgi:DMSO/TMAO reductase YedYZ molybdopterin-dependent catalytic subunit
MACISTWHTTAHLQVLDVCGGVMLAWKMNGKELLPDHGYPVSAPPHMSQHVLS